jgi:5-formyltetrahydrofolate cyclo-ligase
MLSPAMTSPADNRKRLLRAAMLARRDALLPDQRAAAAQTLARLADRVAVRPGEVVAGFVPIRSEIDPRPLMLRLGAHGARLALPVIGARDAPLTFRAWTMGAPLVAGPLAIQQPTEAAPELEPDIVLVPLAAFDRLGHRIGYGGGYYDRTVGALRMRRRLRALGVAFAMQQVETVPASHHDALLDAVLTEAGVIETGATDPRS